MITSHKQEALGVVDRMLSDKFRDLHPMAKPSIIRLTRSVDFSKISTLNEITNSLAQPAIDAAVKRASSFSEAAVNKDKQKIEEQISAEVDVVIKQARKYPDTTRDLMAYLAMEEDLRQKGILDEEVGRPACALHEEISFLEEFIDRFNLIRVNSPQLAAKGLFLIGALIPRSLLRGSSLKAPDASINYPSTAWPKYSGNSRKYRGSKRPVKPSTSFPSLRIG